MTKIDNLVHIAHNVKIGKGCLITAGFAIAGSTEIGDFCTFAGQVGVAPHLKIGNNKCCLKIRRYKIIKRKKYICWFSC